MRHLLLTARFAVLSGLLFAGTHPVEAQTSPMTRPRLNLPPGAVPGSTAERRAALQRSTAADRERVSAIMKPLLATRRQQDQQKVQPGVFRTWKDILQNRNASSFIANNSASGFDLSFKSRTGGIYKPTAKVVREYHGALPSPAAAIQLFGPTDLTDADADGLPDVLEGQVADNFTPIYGISSGEGDFFATFGDYVPQTVTSLVYPPPFSYFRVHPLGLATDVNGVQVYALRIDYLTLWNADGGLVGGGAFCAYSYFGLDSVIGQLTSHELDNERSAMLVAAPAVNGGYNPDPNAYSIYSVYLAAHEGTFFDQSTFADFSPSIPAGNHLNLALSLSKHSTYNFNPNFYPIVPGWFIASTYAGISAAYFNGDITYEEYLIILAAADDVFYACVVERFGDQGGSAASQRVNVGEPDGHSINGSGFIEDNSDRAFHLHDKLTTPLF